MPNHGEAASASRLVVVDADVVGAASDRDQELPQACRHALDAVLKVCHRVALGRTLDGEWRRHRSQYSQLWRSEMISLDKLVYVEPRSHPALDQALAAVQFVAQDPEEARALASRIGKDRHLVEAALAADKIVISRDNKCRAALDRVAAEVHELQQIAWVNPADDPAALRAWLEQGCPVEAHRLLGAATDG